MPENWEEALASLRVLVWIARADRTVSSSEQTVLTEALEQLEPKPQGMTLEQLLAEEILFPQLLQMITTADAQRAVYDAARSLAAQDVLCRM